MAKGVPNFLAALFKRGRMVIPIDDTGIAEFTDTQITTFIHSFAGALTGDATVTYPIADIDSSMWLVSNDTTGGHNLIVQGTSGPSLEVTPGATAWIYADGSQIRAATIPSSDVNDAAVPLPAGAQTVDVTGLRFIALAGDAAGSTITDFTGGVPGQEIHLFFVDTHITLGHAYGHFKLSSGADFVSTAYSTLKLVRHVPLLGGYWAESGRATGNS
jgi:hypothetical protein